MSILNKDHHENEKQRVVSKYVEQFLLVLEREKRTPEDAVNIGVNLILSMKEQFKEEDWNKVSEALRGVL